MNPELKSHISAKSTWIRLLYMILFVVAFNVAELVTGVVVVVQFLFKLVTGRVNERLQGLGHKLAIYFRQTTAFLTYDSEDMPFPFAPWPEGGAEPARTTVQPAPEPPAAANPPAEKTAARPRPKARTAKPKRTPKKPAAEAKSEPDAKAGPPEPAGDEPES